MNHVNNNNTLNKNLSNNYYYNNSLDSEVFFCRVCFRAESDSKDPLVSPCKCTGSMLYIHLSCLKNCIKTRITIKNVGEENTVGYLYTWNNFDCEICLNEYPKYIKHKSIIYQLIDNQTNFEEYCQMEMKVYDEDKQKPVSKGILFIKIEEGQEITIVITRYYLYIFTYFEFF